MPVILVPFSIYSEPNRGRPGGHVQLRAAESSRNRRWVQLPLTLICVVCSYSKWTRCSSPLQ